MDWIGYGWVDGLHLGGWVGEEGRDRWSRVDTLLKYELIWNEKVAVLCCVYDWLLYVE